MSSGWWRNGHEAVSLAALFALVIGAGLAHALLDARTIAPDDVRRLPDGKLLETTQWRGIIAQEPASQYTPHASRRALDRTTFVFRLEAWRATNGRLFGADIATPWGIGHGRHPLHGARPGERIALRR